MSASPANVAGRLSIAYAPALRERGFLRVVFPSPIENVEQELAIDGAQRFSSELLSRSGEFQ